MAEIRWTQEAEIWLKDIYDFIAEDRKHTAEKVIDGIYQRAQILRHHPRIGHTYRTEEEGEVRILLYGHYRITYLLTDKDMILILGVFHGALDIERYLE